MKSQVLKLPEEYHSLALLGALCEPGTAETTQKTFFEFIRNFRFYPELPSFGDFSASTSSDFDSISPCYPVCTEMQIRPCYLIKV